MEAVLQAHKTALPERQVLISLAEKFSKSEERLGKTEVQIKQVWNWFQNRRFAIRAKAAKATSQLNVTQMAREDSAMAKGVPQATQPHAASSVNVRSLPQALQLLTVPSASVRTFPQAPQHPPAFSVQTAARVADNSQMEYEAKSARDGAWYDVSTFLSHRSLETGDPEALVRFAGFGVEEDEWVNVRKHVRQRSLPCESSECVTVLPADLILCFQEGKEQALYFDAHVLDAQRRRHDVRGCRCRFLVRYDHDQSEEIVPLRKICRRPETDYRLQQLHAVNESISANQNKSTANNNSIHTGSSLRVYPPAEAQPKQNKGEPVVPSEAPHKRPRLDSVVPPEGTERQSKVEPDVVTDVPQDQQTVQPAVPASSSQQIVEPQKVEPVAPFPSNQASLEPKEVEPAVPVPSTQGSGESQNAVPVAPTILDEAPVGFQQVQPMMFDVSTEVTVEPHKVETEVVVSLPEASEEHNKSGPVPSGEVPEAVGPAVPPSAEAPVGPHEGGSEVAEPQKELVVSDETKTDEPVMPVYNNDPNVVQEVSEAQNEEPVVHVSPKT
ncbi:hypothetical protein M8C21_012614 [Ambrosia artemisiifolia]|uniref:Homeobox domain-containing protein n=1 Tax=Ambrosia artemisiifolia TaxID=4212 RepID=A0AAD5BS51_AMBAR|nr:hypothetical protein M8C21_012614 [Ambrosia artemisiifolia]